MDFRMRIICIIELKFFKLGVNLVIIPILCKGYVEKLLIRTLYKAQLKVKRRGMIPSFLFYVDT